MLRSKSQIKVLKSLKCKLTKNEFNLKILELALLILPKEKLHKKQKVNLFG
jgi:hypothetical protein